MVFSYIEWCTLYNVLQTAVFGTKKHELTVLKSCGVVTFGTLWYCDLFQVTFTYLGP